MQTDQVAPAIRSNMQLIAQVFDPLAGKRILDIGCGSGALLGALLKRGAHPSGVDSGEAAIATARARFPGLDLAVASASRLPFADAAFDGAVILNSLHHFPAADIATALDEALRVIRPGAPLLIIEPLARGGYFEAMAPIEDEKPERAAALAALDTFLRDAKATRTQRLGYDTAIRVTDAEALIADAVRVDPDRAPRAEAVRTQVADAFARLVRRDGDHLTLDQPMLAAILTRP